MRGVLERWRDEGRGRVVAAGRDQGEGWGAQGGAGGGVVVHIRRTAFLDHHIFIPDATTKEGRLTLNMDHHSKHAASSNCLTACGSTSIVSPVLQATVRLCLASNGKDCSCVSLGFSIGGLGHVIR